MAIIAIRAYAPKMLDIWYRMAVPYLESTMWLG